jgi:enoyl-CoA hydratase/carnithine racemase
LSDLELLDYGVDCDNFDLRRRDGIVQLRLHTDGGSFIFNRRAQENFGELFHRIGRDQDNKVLILTGTGADFCADYEKGHESTLLAVDPAGGWHRMRADADAMLRSFVALDFPTIAVINGPARCHSELPLAADVVLAADTVAFQDAVHVAGAGMAPADGIHIVWTTLLGLNRARYYLLTGGEITAAEAKRWGMVSELHGPGQALDRAWELAEVWARWPRHVLGMWRDCYMAELRRVVDEQLKSGLSYEGFAMAAAIARTGRIG